MTFQIQAANTDSAARSSSADMWTGILAAFIVAFFTALAFAELARQYPKAGRGSAYYFAGKAFLERKEARLRRLARLAKYITGSAANLFYWVYPGVMIALMAVLLTHIAGQFGVVLSVLGQVVNEIVNKCGKLGYYPFESFAGKVRASREQCNCHRQHTSSTMEGYRHASTGSGDGSLSLNMSNRYRPVACRMRQRSVYLRIGKRSLKNRVFEYLLNAYRREWYGVC